MAIRLKTSEQLEQMRNAGRVVRLVLDRLDEMAVPGVTTEEMDVEAERLCRSHGAECLFKGVPGRAGAGPFPGSICASLNDEVVHGIPSVRRKVRNGDVLSVDFGVRLNGWCADAARTYVVGDVSEKVRRLVDVTRNSLALAIGMMRPGEKWSHVARAMQDYVEAEGFSVVREFVGHGIGREMHEDPKVPNFFSRELAARDILLEEGVVLAVEPMVNMGTHAVRYAADGWTVVTRDGLPSAHFEHTVAVVAGGADVLTDAK
ncbi:MAG TPA: type I methionyl aminopeptidase [Phycisphaerales bacterium]|nr:type I methionyl aminopeptidase [Phycisphaerales bacterium]